MIFFLISFTKNEVLFVGSVGQGDIRNSLKTVQNFPVQRSPTMISNKKHGREF